MTFLAIEIQRRLKILGYNLGTSGPNKDGVDGDLGDLSQEAIMAALATGASFKAYPEALPPVLPVVVAPTAIPAHWMPAARMDRIIFHWTAGANKATDFDRAHYHILINGDAGIIRGIPSIDLNDAHGVKPGYAAHTLSCNTGSIGVSLAGMAGAIESPFDPGKQPITKIQFEKLPYVLADLCKRYNIYVTPRTVLSHAEVQKTLGITQRQKWDIAKLPFDSTFKDAYQIGDYVRSRTSQIIKEM